MRGHIHIEMSRWWCPSTTLVSVPCICVLIASVPTIVVAVVHLQLPSHNLKAIQVPDRRSGSVHIAILEEAEAFGLPGLFVVDEPEG